MKIASIYEFQAFPPKGGNHLHALQLVRQFQAAGHEILTWGDNSIPGTRPLSRDSEGARKLEAEADVFYVRIDGNRLGRSEQLAQLLKQTTKPMVWEINSPADESLAFSWLGGNGRRWPGPLDHAKRRFHAFRQSRGIAREDDLRRSLGKKVFAATCVSEGVAKYAREALGINRTRVVPNAADPATHQPTGPLAELPADYGDKLKVLYAGSPTYPWQGLDIIEKTIDLCARHDDPIRFVLLFNQPSERSFDKPNTTVFESVPHERIGDFIRACDVSVALLPDFWWSPWGAYFSPMKVFEYMACGRPVVASRIGQLESIIEPGRNGELFDNTPEDFRTKLLALSQDKEKLARMGRAARDDVVQTYNWGNVARRTLELLQQASGAGGRS